MKTMCLLIGFVIGMCLSHTIHENGLCTPTAHTDDQPRTAQPTDGLYSITITDAVYCYKGQTELTLKELQRAIEVPADGKLGVLTVYRMIDQNRTDIDYVQGLIK